MTPDQIQRLRELAARATPGPWFRYFRDVADSARIRTVHPIDSESGDPVARYIVRQADAEYIAALSPDVVLALLDAAYDGLLWADKAALAFQHYDGADKAHKAMMACADRIESSRRVCRDGHLLVGQVDECGQIYCPHCDVMATPREVWW